MKPSGDYHNRTLSRHGGSHRLATLFLTNRCNLDCAYCYAVENVFSTGQVWDTAVIGRLLDRLAARGYRIAIGGGEPLLELDLLHRTIEEAAWRKMGVALLTNGYLLDESRLHDLHKAGVDWIQISADSAGEIEHFAPILSWGAALGLRMAVGTVLLPHRVPEVEGMHEILENNMATGWRILRCTPIGKRPTAAPAPTNDEWIDMLIEVEDRLRNRSAAVQIRYEPSVAPLAWLVSQPQEKRLDVCGGRSARRLFL